MQLKSRFQIAASLRRPSWSGANGHEWMMAWTFSTWNCVTPCSALPESRRDPRSTHQVPGRITRGQTSICHRRSSWRYWMHIIHVFPLRWGFVGSRPLFDAGGHFRFTGQHLGRVLAISLHFGGAGIAGEPGSCLWLFCFVKPNERNVCVSADVRNMTGAAIKTSLDRGPVMHPLADSCGANGGFFDYWLHLDFVSYDIWKHERLMS